MFWKRIASILFSIGPLYFAAGHPAKAESALSRASAYLYFSAQSVEAAKPQSRDGVLESAIQKIKRSADAPTARASSSPEQAGKSDPKPESIEKLLEKCGLFCPDMPEVDQLRRKLAEDRAREILAEEEAERLTLAAEEAERFAAASGNAEALQDYEVNCRLCEYRYDASAQRLLLNEEKRLSQSAAARTEERQFQSARGDVQALQKYIADCQVCAFGSAALEEINEISAKFERSIFEFRVCNEDFYDLHVAVAGRQGPNSDMWIAEGWWKVETKKCVTIGTFRRGSFFYYAKNKRGSWSGETQVCLSSDRFTHFMSGNDISPWPVKDACPSEEWNAFRKLEVNRSEHTETLIGRPWTWTAVAYSPASLTWGWSGSGHSSKEAAEREAQRFCRSGDCRIGGWARDDHCLVLAEDRRGEALGIAFEEDYETSRYRALNQCRRNGGRTCRIVQNSCGAN